MVRGWGHTYLKEIRMRPLRAIKEIFLSAFFGLGGGAVGVRVGDFGGPAVRDHGQGVVVAYAGAEGGGEEDVAGP